MSCVLPSDMGATPAFSHDPGGYIAVDNLKIVTAASSDIKRNLMASGKIFQWICIADRKANHTISDASI